MAPSGVIYIRTVKQQTCRRNPDWCQVFPVTFVWWTGKSCSYFAGNSPAMMWAFQCTLAFEWPLFVSVSWGVSPGCTCERKCSFTLLLWALCFISCTKKLQDLTYASIQTPNMDRQNAEIMSNHPKIISSYVASVCVSERLWESVW